MLRIRNDGIYKTDYIIYLYQFAWKTSKQSGCKITSHFLHMYIVVLLHCRHLLALFSSSIIIWPMRSNLNSVGNAVLDGLPVIIIEVSCRLLDAALSWISFSIFISVTAKLDLKSSCDSYYLFAILDIFQAFTMTLSIKLVKSGHHHFFSVTEIL